MNVLATLHIADLYREPRMRIPTMMDWAKIPRILAGTWPEPVPARIVVRSGDAVALDAALALMDSFQGSYAVIDTEYNRETKFLLLLGIGLSNGSNGSDLVGCQIEWHHLSWWHKQQVARRVKTLVRGFPVVFQNLLADMPVLEQAMEIVPEEYKRVDDLMLAHAVLWSEWPHDLEFLASLYGHYPKMKHLAEDDPLMYNWGDVLETASAWEAVSKELAADPASKAIYEGQSLPIARSLLASKKRGIRVNRPRVEQASGENLALVADAERLARAWVGWPLNLGSNPHVSLALYGHAGLARQKHKKTKKVTIDADAIATLRTQLAPFPDLEEEERHGLTLDQALARIEEGANPVLEARVLFAGARQIESHYLRPALAAPDGRFYPDFLLHAQASGRWSTNHPPLAQLPEDLRDILQPDEGWPWLGWDWDQIELRLNAALSGDTPTLQAFEQGWDIHTLNACDLFGYPHPQDLRDPHGSGGDGAWRGSLGWQGKGDTRRVFAKRFVYRLDYGGDPRLAGDIPGAKVLGLTAAKLVQVANRYLAAHPAKAAWRLRVAGEARTTRESRTFCGRLRKLMGDSQQIVREAFNHPMQGGVADIFNLTYVRILTELPSLRWVYGMHDSQWWACPQERVQETWPRLKALVEAAWDVAGVTVAFPATWKERAA